MNDAQLLRLQLSIMPKAPKTEWCPVHLLYVPKEKPENGLTKNAEITKIFKK